MPTFPLLTWFSVAITFNLFPSVSAVNTWCQYCISITILAGPYCRTTDYPIAIMRDSVYLINLFLFTTDKLSSLKDKETGAKLQRYSSYYFPLWSSHPYNKRYRYHLQYICNTSEYRMLLQGMRLEPLNAFLTFKAAFTREYSTQSALPANRDKGTLPTRHVLVLSLICSYKRSRRT